MKSNLKPHPIQLYRDSVLVKQQQTLNELDLQYDAYVKRIRNQQKEIKKQMKLLFYREITGIDSDIANFNININNNNHTIGTHNKSIKMDIYAISNNINNRKHHTNNNRNIPILGAGNAQKKNKNNKQHITTTTPSSNTKHNKNPCYPSSKNNLMHSENAQNNTFNINQINSINKPFCNGIIPPLPSLPPLPPLPPISTLNSIKSLPSIPSQFLTQSTNGKVHLKKHIHDFMVEQLLRLDVQSISMEKMIVLLNEEYEEEDVINCDSLSFIAQQSRIVAVIESNDKQGCFIKLQTNNKEAIDVYHELNDREKICDDELFRERLLKFYNVYNPDFLKKGIDVNRVVSENEGKAAEVFKHLEEKYILEPLNEWNAHNYNILHIPLYCWEQKAHHCNKDEHKQNEDGNDNNQYDNDVNTEFDDPLGTSFALLKY